MATIEQRIVKLEANIMASEARDSGVDKFCEWYCAATEKEFKLEDVPCGISWVHFMTELYKSFSGKSLHIYSDEELTANTRERRL